MGSKKAWNIVFFFLVVIFINKIVYSYEFLYPVAKIELDRESGDTRIYVLYQKSVTHLELWVWDPKTKIASKGLMSTYIPASVKMLPTKDGFSFIDEGRIRIKKFKKRSPKTIDIYEPIYEINQIEWIDGHNFYLSAKKNGKFCLFQISDMGQIHCIMQDSISDCVYPQKIDDKLFYIERYLKDGEYKKNHISYKLISAEYPVIENKEQDLTNLGQEEFEKQINKIFTEEKIESAHDEKVGKKTIIADFKSSPIAFLKMISDKEGFFLQHETEIDRHDKLITFNCYYLKKEDNKWSCKNIFDFSVPACLILDVLDFRLYESILPLIPRYHNGFLYYIDASSVKTENLNLFRYDIETEVIEQKSFGKSGQIFFSPIFTQNKAFYGGCVNNKCKFAPKMWINDQGLVCFDLPFVKFFQ